MLTLRALALALIALSLSPALFADDLINADRPGIADSSATVSAGTFQIEAGLERDHSKSDGVDERDLSTPLLLRYGLTKTLEARIETNGFTWISQTSSGVRQNDSGLSPLSAGIKWHFLEQDASHHRPSLGTIVRLFVPSGSGPLKSDHAAGDVRLVADLDLNEKWSINPNIGIAIHNDGARFTSALAAMTLQYNLSDHANAFVDAGFEVPEERHGRSSLLLDAGAAWILGRDVQLDVSAGWRAAGQTAPNVFLSAGISRRF